MQNRWAVVTTTFSKDLDDPRLQLALQTMKGIYRHTGTRAIVVDASPLQEIKEALRAAGGHVFDQLPNTTMGSARRQAIQIALDQKVETVVWMEPEKHPLTPFLLELIEA